MAVADLQPVYGDWWASTPSPSGVVYFGIHSLNGIGPPSDEIDIMPMKLAGLTVISTELPNMASRADRDACTERVLKWHNGSRAFPGPVPCGSLRRLLARNFLRFGCVHPGFGYAQLTIGLILSTESRYTRRRQATSNEEHNGGGEIMGRSQHGHGGLRRLGGFQCAEQSSRHESALRNGMSATRLPTRKPLLGLRRS